MRIFAVGTKIFGGGGGLANICGACAPWPQRRTVPGQVNLADFSVRVYRVSKPYNL